MSDQLDRTNRESLATISAYVTIPYLWIALLVGLYLLLRGSVLVGIPGIVLSGLLCLGILTGAVPFFMVKNAVQPFFLNLLGRDLVPASGCVTGLATFFLVCFSVLFFIGRDLQLAATLFFSAPLVGILATFVAVLLVRGGLFKSRRMPKPPQITGGPRRPSLPPSQQQGQISSPPKPSGQLSRPQQKPERPTRPGRTPPPRRRD